MLNIYNWSDYIGDDTIKNFEKETGIKVRYDVFDNNEILNAKLVAGKSGYDIVVPTAQWARLQIDAGLLRKLDKSKLTNLGNLDQNLQAKLAKIDPNNDYLVDWLWGYTTVGINVNKVKAALGGMPMPDNAWDLVFDPKYAAEAEIVRRLLPRLAVGSAAGRPAIPGQARLLENGWRLPGSGQGAASDPPLRDPVQLVWLHQ